jgi:hypothetical protein
MTITIQPAAHKERVLFKVKEVPKLAEFSWLTESSLRHLIFNSRPRVGAKGQVISGNGMSEAGVIKKFGTRILIDINRLRSWVEANCPVDLTMNLD